MVGDGRHQAESRGKYSVHIGFGRQYQNGEVFGGAEQRRDQPVEGALEGPVQRLPGGDGVDDGTSDGRPGHPGEEGDGEDGRTAQGHQQRGAEADTCGTRHERGERAIVREVRQRLRRPVRATGLAGERAQYAARRGVRRGERAADEQRVEGDAGGRQRREDGDHRPSFADGQDYHPAHPDRPADAVELVREGGGGAGVGGGVVVRLVEGEVHDVPAGLQDHRAEREGPYVVAAARRSEGEARVVGVLLGAVEGRVQPGAERRVLQRVAGELPVRAVQDEGEQEQQPGRDESGAGAGGGAARGDQRGDQRGGGDLVRGQAAAGAPAGDVARVRADAVRGEEAVAGLHGTAQAYGFVVHGGDGLPDLVALLRVGGNRGDEGAELGAEHGDAVRVEGRGEALGEVVGGDGETAGGGALTGHGPGQRPARLGLHRYGAGQRGGREPWVREAEAQCVQVPHEAGVDDGDPLVRRYGGQQRLGVTGFVGEPHVEAERPQIALERRSGDRLAGEDGGRQRTHSLSAGAASRRACT